MTQNNLQPPEPVYEPDVADVFDDEKQYHLQVFDSNPDNETRQHSREWLDKYSEVSV